ncbi:transposase, partial [Escherichia coli]|uniref:transposase n=1 Tax=Escherichia coli TaxID=562 RepID=UPI0029C207D7
QLVAASCEPGISISKLALENGINANLLFKWRQQWREGKLLLPSHCRLNNTSPSIRFLLHAYLVSLINKNISHSHFPLLYLLRVSRRLA